MRPVWLVLPWLLAVGLAAEAATKEPRSGRGPCRVAAQALIGYLDAGDEKGRDYAHAYTMVDSCGPVRTAKSKSSAVQPVADRALCRDLALKMLDELDENRMNRPSFVKVRDAFAEKCGPAKLVEPEVPSRR
jgi:hypothetical protein